MGRERERKKDRENKKDRQGRERMIGKERKTGAGKYRKRVRETEVKRQRKLVIRVFLYIVI